MLMVDQSATAGNESIGSIRAGQTSRARRGVAETSREAFHSLPVEHYLQPKQLAVLKLFTGPEVHLSRQQISAMVPMSINGVCGRVDSLVTAGLLQEHGERRDPITGKRQKLLRLAQDDVQGSLLKGVA
jgi:hypothetical protein